MIATIPRADAHRELVTKHNSMTWIGNNGRLSLRKRSGRFYMAVEDFSTGQVTRNSFATLPGVLVAAETVKEYFL